VTAPGPDVEAFLGRLRGIAAEWESAHSELESLRVSATSADGLATAAADSGGGLVGLSLAPDLRPHGGSVVAAAVLEAGAEAVARANARRAELVSASVGLAVAGRHRAAGRAGAAGPDAVAERGTS